MVSPSLSPDDHRRVEQAITAAERRTTGEIVCVLAREVSSYPEVPITAGLVAALAIAPALLALGFDPAWLWRLTGDWKVAQAAAAPAQVHAALDAYILFQTALFVVVALAASIPAVRRLLTPTALKHARVRQAARQQFLATGLAAHVERTGVVIFTSLHDRQVEIVADQSIHAACGDAVWKAAVTAVQQGMREGDPAGGLTRAVEICGEALAAHFPSDGGGPNTLSDRVLEI
jgi:putative membrane protein